MNFTLSSVSTPFFQVRSFSRSFMELVKALDYLDTANNGSTKAEAQVRARLDVILGLVLGFAKKEGRVVTKRMVSWGYETQFWATVRMGPEMVKLSGRPDYALWYGAQASLETNLLVVEAERTERLGWGERQLLAYMGKYPPSYQRHCLLVRRPCSFWPNRARKGGYDCLRNYHRQHHLQLLSDQREKQVVLQILYLGVYPRSKPGDNRHIT